MKEIFNFAEEKMSKSVAALERDYTGVRVGRASPSILDRVMVEYYGTPTQINAVAAISVPEPRMLVIQPWDATLLRDIEKAILMADIGINPNNDGKVIRLIFPQLTEERRRELTKETKKMAEDSKVAIRSIRRDAIEKLKAKKKDGEITEDDVANGEKKIQTITDKFVAQVDSVAAAKEKEIMEL